jgi:hypothetical protein
MNNQRGRQRNVIAFLIVFFLFAMIPVPEEIHLSGRNWSIGFPFWYFDFRQHFPGRNYGGHRNFDLLALLVDAAIAAISVQLLKLFCARCFPAREEGAFWLLTACFLIAGYGIQGSAGKAFEALFATNPGLAWGFLGILANGALFCLLALISCAIKGRSVRSPA